VDWPQALANLISITPTNIQVQSFAGTTAASSPTSGTSSTTTAAIGSVGTNLTGPGPGLTSPSRWTSAIANDPQMMFANPVPSSVTTEANGTVAFPSTISVTAYASLAKNASLQ